MQPLLPKWKLAIDLPRHLAIPNLPVFETLQIP